ncbi:hypothetical protein Y032_0141g2233 [Ancylostoma ceylanicum]|nr:hypothetical protein Y032_0141g2233 [Ancylostoma ceylanicum]
MCTIDRVSWRDARTPYSGALVRAFNMWKRAPSFPASLASFTQFQSCPVNLLTTEITAVTGKHRSFQLGKNIVRVLESDVPENVVEKLRKAVQNWDETLDLKAGHVTFFLDENIHRYAPTNATKETTADPQSEPCSSQQNSCPNTSALPVLEKTEPALLVDYFLVQGQKLLELFRYCPKCGAVLDESRGCSVRLTAKEKTPFVDLICRNCWQSTGQQRWEGAPNEVAGEQKSHQEDSISDLDSDGSNDEGNASIFENGFPLGDGERLKSKVNISFRCALCGCMRDFEYCHQAPGKERHSAVLIASLMLFKSLDEVSARSVYRACSSTRKMLCCEHFAENAKYLATEVILGDGHLPNIENYSHITFIRDISIPAHLVDVLNMCIQRVVKDFTFKPQHIAHFISRCVTKYGPGTKFEKLTPIDWPTGVPAAVPWTLPPLDVPRETELVFTFNRKIFKKLFPVEGRKLLELFRFCRTCGAAVEKANGSSVCLTAEGRKPIVDVLCGMCWISKRPQIRWEGQRGRAVNRTTAGAFLNLRSGTKDVPQGSESGLNISDGQSLNARGEGEANTAVTRFHCVLCACNMSLNCGRMSFNSPTPLAIMLSSLVLYVSLSMNTARAVYMSCRDNRKMMCKRHFAEAARFIADDLFSELDDVPSVVSDIGSIYKKDSDVPDVLVRDLNDCARNIDETLTVTAEDIGHFLNGYLVRNSYTSEGNIQVITGWPPDRCDLSLEPHCDVISTVPPPLLEETDVKLLDQFFLVDASKLYYLFQYCPVCGIAIEKKDQGSVRLQQHEATAYVDVVCGVCWISNGIHRRWQGIREGSDDHGETVGGVVQERMSLKRKLSSDIEKSPSTSTEIKTVVQCLQSASSTDSPEHAQPGISADTADLPSTSADDSQLAGTTGTNPALLHSMSSTDGLSTELSKKIKSKGLLRYRCVLCGCTRDVCHGRMSSSSRQLTGVLLTALLTFKRLDIERARMTYGFCFAKRKMLCRKHYIDAATCIAGETTSNISGPPGGNSEGFVAANGFEVPQHLLDCLNTWARKLDVALFITPPHVGHFVNGSGIIPDKMAEPGEGLEHNGASASKIMRTSPAVEDHKVQHMKPVAATEGESTEGNKLFSLADIKVEEG